VVEFWSEATPSHASLSSDSPSPPAIMRSLIAINEWGSYQLAPNATVTVLRVDEPGKWTTPSGVPGARRKYVVSVSFRVHRVALQTGKRSTRPRGKVREVMTC